MPNIHFAAGATAKVRPGPPGEQVQELTSRFSECLTRLRLLDAAKLVPLEGLVWTLYVDLVVLNDAGNDWDALWAGLLAALRDTMLPILEMDSGAGVVLIREQAAVLLELQCLPASMTAAYLLERDAFLVDPSDKEAPMADAVVSIIYDLADPSRVLWTSQSASLHGRMLPPALIEEHRSALRPYFDL